MATIAQQDEETHHCWAVPLSAIGHAPLKLAPVGPVFDTAADAVVLVDACGVIVAVNLAAEQMFHCDEAQLVGTPVLRWIDPEHRASHLADMIALAEGRTLSVSRGLVDKHHAVRFDGQAFAVDVTKSDMLLAGQRLQTLTVRDISKREHMRDAVFKSRAKLAAAMVNIPASVCIADARSLTMEFNDGFIKLNHLKSRQECNPILVEFHAELDFATVSGVPLSMAQRPTFRALKGESGVDVDCKVTRKNTAKAGSRATALGRFGMSTAPSPARSSPGAMSPTKGGWWHN